jgi:nitroreductase/ferredoxin
MLSFGVIHNHLTYTHYTSHRGENMSLFTIDMNVCTSCGNCVAECPIMIIAMPNKEDGPIPVKNAEELCINCGHCVAVCPYDALSHRCGKPEDLSDMKAYKKLSKEEAEHFLRSRRSIRNYKKTPVDENIIKDVINVASYSPSGHNMQPVQWLVVHDTEKVKELTGHVADWMKDMIEKQPDMAKMMHFDMLTKGWDAGIDAICRNAPHLVIAYGHKMNPTARDAATIALTFFDLAAPSHDLGSCWAGYFSIAANAWPPLKEALGLPEHHTCLGTMMVGYPLYKYKKMPQRNKPKITVL